MQQVKSKPQPGVGESTQEPHVEPKESTAKSLQVFGFVFVFRLPVHIFFIFLNFCLKQFTFLIATQSML